MLIIIILIVNDNDSYLQGIISFFEIKIMPKAQSKDQRGKPKNQLYPVWITVVTKETFKKDASPTLVMKPVRI